MKPKISRKEYSNKTVRIISTFYEAEKFYAQIADQVKVLWPSVTHIICWTICIQTELYYPIKWASRLLILDNNFWQILILHLERNSNNNLATLGIYFKLGIILSCKILRRYLKTAGYLRFKVQRKLYLIIKLQDARLRLANKYME